MNISAIQTFLAVTRIRNLNRAAEELNVTQSTVTARLDRLEGALGVKLLNRARTGATLTKAGYAFLEQAEVISRSWQTARARAGLPRGVTQLFSFVCDPSLWSGLGKTWVEEARRAHAGLAVEVWSGLTADARRWLGSGMSDAALLPEPLVAEAFESRIFAEDRLVQVATRQREVVRWDPEYVFVDYGPAFRAQHAEAWPGDETAALSFSNPDWALAHLLAEGGSAYLPERMVAGAVADGRLYHVEGATAFSRASFLSWRKASQAAFDWLPATT